MKNMNQMIKNFGARAVARAAHAKSHLALKTQKSLKIGLEDKIFCMCARKCAHAINFLPSYILWNSSSSGYCGCIHIFSIDCCVRIWNVCIFMKKKSFFRKILKCSNFENFSDLAMHQLDVKSALGQTLKEFLKGLY